MDRTCYIVSAQLWIRLSATVLLIQTSSIIILITQHSGLYTKVFVVFDFFFLIRVLKLLLLIYPLALKSNCGGDNKKIYFLMEHDCLGNGCTHHNVKSVFIGWMYSFLARLMSWNYSYKSDCINFHSISILYMNMKA